MSRRILIINGVTFQWYTNAARKGSRVYDGGVEIQLFNGETRTYEGAVFGEPVEAPKEVGFNITPAPLHKLKEWDMVGVYRPVP